MSTYPSVNDKSSSHNEAEAIDIAAPHVIFHAFQHLFDDLRRLVIVHLCFLRVVKAQAASENVTASTISRDNGISASSSNHATPNQNDQHHENGLLGKILSNKHAASSYTHTSTTEYSPKQKISHRNIKEDKYLPAFQDRPLDEKWANRNMNLIVVCED